MPKSESQAARVISRRSFLKRSSLGAISFIGLCSLPFYSYYKERLWLDTVKLELPFPSLPKSFDGVKIAHFSDVHYGFHYGVEELSRLIAEIDAHQPDLIAFTGDLFDGAVLPYHDEC